MLLLLTAALMVFLTILIILCFLRGKEYLRATGVYNKVLRLVEEDDSVKLTLVNVDKITSTTGKIGKGLYNSRTKEIFLSREIKNPLGRAYILAHEYGHHLDFMSGRIDKTYKENKKDKAAEIVETRAILYALHILEKVIEEGVAGILQVIKIINMPVSVLEDINMLMEQGDYDDSVLQKIEEKINVINGETNG